MFRPISLLFFAALLPILQCRLVVPHVDGIIGWNSSQANTMETFQIPDDNSGCRWFGTAPYCMGKCPKLWTEERAASRRFSLFSFQPSVERGFGDACLPSYKKLYCCHTNEMDPTWSGHWVSTQTGRSRLCSYELSANETVGYCGSLSCEEKGVEVIDYEITGLHCNTIRDESENAIATARNGTMFWTTDGKFLDRWVKHTIIDPVEFEYD